VDEHGVDVAETTVRDLVRKRRRELGLAVGEVFVPQVHGPGRTAEVDWGEADVDLVGTRTRVHLFHMRSCFSGAAFTMASPVETQQAFLEGHALAFTWFGGVFCEVSYEYVPGHIFVVLCPIQLCGRG
jgi:transposase